MCVQDSCFRLNIVVVLYRMTESQSSTLCTLKHISASSHLLSGSRLIIWNNSPEASSEGGDFSGLGEVVRMHTPENRSLSSIYNYCAKKYEGVDGLCILDQDTTLNYTYFSELIDAIRIEQDVQCFLPLVRAGTTTQLVSPGSLNWIKGKYWTQPQEGRIASRNILAIASGMVVRASYLDSRDKPFDERLNLYGIDSKFMIDYAKDCPTVYVLKTCLNHGHSSHEKEPVETKLFRFLNWKYAWRVINSESIFKLLAYEFYAFYQSVRLAIRFRNIGFLRMTP